MKGRNPPSPKNAAALDIVADVWSSLQFKPQRGSLEETPSQWQRGYATSTHLSLQVMAEQSVIKNPCEASGVTQAGIHPFFSLKTQDDTHVCSHN